MTFREGEHRLYSIGLLQRIFTLSRQVCFRLWPAGNTWLKSKRVLSPIKGSLVESLGISAHMTVLMKICCLLKKLQLVLGLIPIKHR